MQDDLAASIGDRQARVEVALPEGVQVLMDADDLRIVLQNLVGNAIKFSDADVPVVTIAAERRGDDWCISVLDNGPGIAPEHRSRIFQPFERVAGRSAGYGLGLATCQRLVERHGGRIGVEPTRDRGTRFWFTLPACDPGSRVVPGSQAITEPA